MASLNVSVEIKPIVEFVQSTTPNARGRYEMHAVFRGLSVEPLAATGRNATRPPTPPPDNIG